MNTSLVTALTIAAAVTSSAALATTESKVFEGKGLEKLTLRNTSGNTKIALSTDGKAHVVATKEKFDKVCKFDMKKEGNTLFIEVKKEGFFTRGDCKVHFDIKVPKAIALDLRAGSGDLEAKGTKGEVDFRTGSGDAHFDVEADKLEARTGSGSVNVTGVIGNVDLNSGSGDVELSGLHGESEINTGSGDVKLTYKTTPKSGQVNLKTGSGDATVLVPATTKLLTKVKTSSGTVFNELGDSSDASFVISMNSGSGNFKLKKLQ